MHALIAHNLFAHDPALSRALSCHPIIPPTVRGHDLCPRRAKGTRTLYSIPGENSIKVGSLEQLIDMWVLVVDSLLSLSVLLGASGLVRIAVPALAMELSSSHLFTVRAFCQVQGP